MIPFVKTEALGNDFVLVCRPEAGDSDYPALATRLCDRRLGVGADGVILWNEPNPADGPFGVRIFNADGSEAECSGNGLRCLAAYLFSRRGFTGRLHLETVSGAYCLERADAEYVADMGVPNLKPADVPVHLPDAPDRVVGYPLQLGEATYRVTCCATGNPHCSLFVDEPTSVVESLGPRLERHEAFPNGTNVEFIRVISRAEVEVSFWERGAGRTPASGTGSCAAVVASVLNDRTDRIVTVHTPNGRLLVEWNEKGRLMLTAGATVVAEGQYLLS